MWSFYTKWLKQIYLENITARCMNRVFWLDLEYKMTISFTHLKYLNTHCEQCMNWYTMRYKHHLQYSHKNSLSSFENFFQTKAFLTPAHFLSNHRTQLSQQLVSVEVLGCTCSISAIEEVGSRSLSAGLFLVFF